MVDAAELVHPNHAKDDITYEQAAESRRQIQQPHDQRIRSGATRTPTEHDSGYAGAEVEEAVPSIDRDRVVEAAVHGPPRRQLQTDVYADRIG